VRWESDGEGSYAVETVSKADRGTAVTLHFREGEDEFLDGFRLRNIIHKYSDHISLPIVMKKDDQDEDETVNRASALWARPKKDITEQEYYEFYKHIGHDFEAPLTYIHSQVEGRQSYISLFYIPQRAPFDLWDRQQRHGIKLYVRRVFIMDASEQLLPHYLRFVRGIVDSDDLPLNVSREILQHNRTVDSMRSASVKKILGLLEDLAEKDREKYATVWQEFGRVLKEGPAEDFANRERVAKLLRFASTHDDSEAQTVSLDDYLGRMQDGQDKIYYITAESFAAAKHSPHLEVFRKQGIEVLLLSDRVDEWLVSNLPEYSGKSLQSVAKGALDLGKLEDEGSAEEIKKAEEQYKGLLERMKTVLGERVKEVRISHRLTQSPACLVVEEHDMGTSMRNILKAAGHDVPTVAPILEINPNHNLVARLNDEQNEQRFSDWASILFDQSLLAEGGQLDDPASFVRRLNEMLLLLAH
jgi:molecular chaperone HtpG